MKNWYSAALVLMAWPVWADVVKLNDGTQMEGTLQRESGGWVVTDKAGKATHVSDSQIAGIEKTGTTDAATVAESKLKALRRTVEGMSDLNLIIDRYTRFIAESKGTPAATTAGQELEVWKARQAKGMVKAGQNWLTPDEQRELLGKSAGVIDEARMLIKDGRYREAEGVINKLLEMDSANASGFYLRGLAAYKVDQLGQAKKALERVRELMPSHGPTLNNLAVIAWRQEQYPTAMLLYDQAMLGLPKDRRVLDNVAEALEALPGDLRDSNVTQRVMRRFKEQDTELQKQLAAEGLTRWEAVYITKEQVAEVKKVQGKLDLLTQDYEKVKARIEELDRQIANNERTLGDIQEDRRVYDWTKKEYTILRKPGVYYDVKRDIRRLEEDRAALQDKLPTYEVRRQAILRESMVPRVTGIQRVIETEGTPLALPQGGGKAGAETQPTTRAD